MPVRVALGQVLAAARKRRYCSIRSSELLGRLGRAQLVELLDLLAGQHQPRLQLEQRGDQDEELGRGLEIELVGGLQVVHVGDHDLGQVHFEQVQFLPQDQGEQQIEGPRKDVEVSSSRRCAPRGD